MRYHTSVPQIVSLVSGDSQAHVATEGARIESLSLNKNTVLTTVERGDGKRANTHPCSPLFAGQATAYGFSQHGPTRSAEWDIQSFENTTALSLKTAIQPTELFSTTVLVEQQHTLVNDAYTITTTHHNTGSSQAPVNFGHHFYWHTTADEWRSAALNGTALPGLLQSTDHATLQLVGSHSTVQLGERVIQLEHTGFLYAVVWSYYPQKNYSQRDTHYLCVELVEFNPDTTPSEDTLLAPDAHRQNMVTIRCR